MHEPAQHHDLHMFCPTSPLWTDMQCFLVYDILSGLWSEFSLRHVIERCTALPTTRLFGMLPSAAVLW